jgi:hypothetical protein
MKNSPQVARVSGVQEFFRAGEVASKKASLLLRTMKSGTQGAILWEANLGETHAAGEALLNTDADTLYIQTTGNNAAAAGRALFSNLRSNKEATITIWLGDAPPQTVRLDVGKLVSTESFAKAIVGGDRALGPALDKTAKEERARQADFAPLFKDCREYEQYLESTDPQSGKPPRMRWWCIAIFCVPAAGLIGFAIPHCRRGD